jgi:S1-C subfamily serine protease
LKKNSISLLVVFAFLIILSVYNLNFLFLNQNEIIELQQKITEINENISKLESNMVNISNITFEDLNELSTLIEKINFLAQQNPANVYNTSYRSVVVVTTPSGQGSGFFYRNSNTILTNWHVIEGESDIEVEFYDGTRSKAEVIGSDAYADIGVISVQKSPLLVNPLTFGNSSTVYIGQQVVAIGNPLGLTGSLSSGYISQINKLIDVQELPIIVPVLQIDLTIAPGSSGGPLLNLRGDVLGITNAGTGVGLNFAVPSNIVEKVAISIIDKGYYNHPFIGFTGVELSPDTIENLNIVNLESTQKGILIWEILPDTPAEKADLRGVESTVTSEGVEGYIAKDILIAVNNVTILTQANYASYVEENVVPNQEIILTLWRSEEIISIKLSTTSRPRYDE